MNLSVANEWICIELPVLPYRDVLNLQHELMFARKNKVIEKDIVLFLEHDPVFTLGRSCGTENLKVSEDFLEKQNIPIIRVERGGNITFHGPGQLIAYPIVDLKKAKLPVLEYIDRLEEVMIRVADDWGIKAQRKSINRGVWVGNNKLGSVGISVQRDISFHGLALNVNMLLQPFDWINPCGLEDIQMTSMAKELSAQVPMNRVRESVRHHFESVFGVELMLKRLPDLK
ncbi:MAG: lipoyl(octanoyl) transferase LipB, partial [Desulfobacterales bacterium]